jgi:translation initiation factor IF-2
LAIGSFKELNIQEGDVDGSVEPLPTLCSLSTPEVKVNILSKVGAISESDVLLVSADAIIIGFQVRPAAPGRAGAD